MISSRTGSRSAQTALSRITPARLNVGRAGSRYTTRAWLEFRADHARASDAVFGEVPRGWARRNGLFEVASMARSREEFLLKPELGRRLSRDSIAQLRRYAGAARAKVLICIGDGLSSAAVEAKAVELARKTRRRLGHRHRVGPLLFIRNARVRIQDHLGELLRPAIVCLIIGERPGLATAESLSAYVIYRPTRRSREPDRTVVSNIHPQGLKIARAAEKIARLIDDAMRYRATGAALAQASAP